MIFTGDNMKDGTFVIISETGEPVKAEKNELADGVIVRDRVRFFIDVDYSKLKLYNKHLLKERMKEYIIWKKRFNKRDLYFEFMVSRNKIDVVIKELEKEGFIIKQKGRWVVKDAFD